MIYFDPPDNPSEWDTNLLRAIAHVLAFLMLIFVFFVCGIVIFGK